MDIAVVDAVEMREHGNAGFILHPRDQRFAATRNDHVNRTLCAQHQADHLAVLCGNQLNRVGG